MPYYEYLKDSELFKGLTRSEIEELLPCMNAYERHYEKNGAILRSGEPCDAFGVILSGRVNVVKDDFWGNRNIIGQFGDGQMFAETFSCVPVPLEVSVIAAERSRILFLSPVAILTDCPNHCAFHRRLMQNFMSIIAMKNLLLTRKMDHITKRSMRRKLLSYLSDMSNRSNSPYFAIPFNRQELADYLSVDRSALSAELSRLKKEGVLDYYKNRFRLLKPDK